MGRSMALKTCRSIIYWMFSGNRNYTLPKELKKLRKRWLKLPNQLEVDALIARADWRRRFPQLREVIDWVQDLRKWFERKYDKSARVALWQLIERARESALAPLQGVGGT